MHPKRYLEQHRYALAHSLRQVQRGRLSVLMTIAVIGIALALPAGLYAMLKNAQRVTAAWGDLTQISLFLKKGVTETQANAVAQRMRGMREVASVQVVTPAQALDEFRALSGFGEALRALEDNPLPAALIVRPAASEATPEAVQRLLERLKRVTEVEFAQLDMQWLQRLDAVLEIGKRAAQVLAALLGLAVLLVVGNTIRLAIQDQRDEIEVTKLIGATDAFVRRPFLYAGAGYGALGGSVAWGLVSLALALLAAPIQHLAALYNSSFALGGLDLTTGASLVLAGALLGLLGSWLAVGRHLRALTP